MKFIIKNTNNAYEHISNSLLIYIYKFSKTNYDENENSVLHGNIETLYGYQSNVDYLELLNMTYYALIEQLGKGALSIKIYIIEK